MAASKFIGWNVWATCKSDKYVSIAGVLVAMALCTACRSGVAPSLTPHSLPVASPTPANTAIATGIASGTVPPILATPVNPTPPPPSPTPFLTGYGIQPPTATLVNGYPAPHVTPITPPTAVPTALVASTLPVAVNAISPANAASLRPATPVAPPSFDGAEQKIAEWSTGLGPILDVAFSKDGGRLAVAKAYGVFVYDLQALHPLRFIDTGNAIPLRIAFLPGGNKLVVSTHDYPLAGVRGATFFDIASGQRVGQIRWGTSPNGIDSTIARLSPDGRILLIQQNFGAELFDSASRQPLPFWPRRFLAANYAFSPDSRLFATGFGAVTVWDLATHRVVFNATERGTAAIQQPDVAFSPDGSLFATADTRRLVAWDVLHAQKLMDVPFEGVPSGTGNPILFAPNNQMLVIPGDRQVVAWRVPSGELALKTSGTAAVFSPDSTTLLIPTGQHRIAVWDVATARQRLELAGDSPQYGLDGRLLIQLAADRYAFADGGTGQVQPAFFALRPRFGPDGRLFDCGDDGSVRSLDGQGQPLQAMGLRPQHSPLTSVTFLRDGRLVMAYGNGTLRQQTDDPQLVNNPFAAVDQGGWIYQVIAAPDGSSLLSASTDSTIARFTPDDYLYDYAHPAIFGGQPGELTSVAVSPDGQRLAAGSSDSTVKLWDSASPIITPTQTLAGHTNWIWSVAFSPDGRQLASGSADQTVRLWDVATGAVVRILAGHTGAVHSVVYSPDGSLLASGAWDGTLRLWDAAGGVLLHVLTAGPAKVNQVAFSRDGRVVAAAVDDGTVRLWESATGRSLATLHADGGAVWSIAFSPDGRRLAAGMNDGTAQLWDAP
jgi:WD40 repeat protein